MGLPAVQTVFLGATVLIKIILKWNMAPSSALAMVLTTIYMTFYYPKAWKVIVNTLPRDVK